MVKPVIPTPKPKPEPIDNTKLVNEFRASGGQILHCPPTRRPAGRLTRGMTFAFAVRSGHVEVATAVQHRTDVFTKKLGTRTAISHFHDGHTVCIPLYSGANAVGILKDVAYFTL